MADELTRKVEDWRKLRRSARGEAASLGVAAAMGKQVTPSLHGGVNPDLARIRRDVLKDMQDAARDAADRDAQLKSNLAKLKAAAAAGKRADALSLFKEMISQLGALEKEQISQSGQSARAFGGDVLAIKLEQPLAQLQEYENLLDSTKVLTGDAKAAYDVLRQDAAFDPRELNRGDGTHPEAIRVWHQMSKMLGQIDDPGQRIAFVRTVGEDYLGLSPGQAVQFFVTRAGLHNLHQRNALGAAEMANIQQLVGDYNSTIEAYQQTTQDAITDDQGRSVPTVSAELQKLVDEGRKSYYGSGAQTAAGRLNGQFLDLFNMYLNGGDLNSPEATKLISAMENATPAEDAVNEEVDKKTEETANVLGQEDPNAAAAQADVYQRQIELLDELATDTPQTLPQLVQKARNDILADPQFKKWMEERGYDPADTHHAFKVFTREIKQRMMDARRHNRQVTRDNARRAEQADQIQRSGGDTMARDNQLSAIGASVRAPTEAELEKRNPDPYRNRDELRRSLIFAMPTKSARSVEPGGGDTTGYKG